MIEKGEVEPLFPGGTDTPDVRLICPNPRDAMALETLPCKPRARREEKETVVSCAGRKTPAGSPAPFLLQKSGLLLFLPRTVGVFTDTRPFREAE